jgi:formylglycine-generating enzyme required for sulfatase activity
MDGPVNAVTWFDAARYCNRLSELEGLRPVYRVWEQERAEVDASADGYRLPTEAEWEYAARAGTETRWSFGEDESELEHYAWYDKNGGSITHTVAEKRANPWGLFDVHGNVWEWCENRPSTYNAAPSAVDDPFVSQVVDRVADNVPRALRGGSAWPTPRGLRSAYRNQSHPRDSFSNVGFRCVRGPARHPGRSSVVP